MRETGVRSLVREDPWRRKWQPTPVFLPGKSHRRRSLVGYSPRGPKELDMTEWLHFHFLSFCPSFAQSRETSLNSVFLLYPTFDFPGNFKIYQDCNCFPSSSLLPSWSKSPSSPHWIIALIFLIFPRFVLCCSGNQCKRTPSQGMAQG